MNLNKIGIIGEIDIFLKNINNYEGTLYKDLIICYNYFPVIYIYI